MKRYETWPFRVTRAGFRCLGLMSPQLAALAAEQVFRTPRRHARPTREHAWLRDAEGLRVRVGISYVRAWSWGTTGPVALLVHGWEGRGAQLGAFVRPLLDRGFRVVAFDAPGHGESPGRLSSLPEFVDAIWAISRQVARPQAIVAHSLGAAAAVTAVAEGLELDRIALLAPPADFGEALGRFAQVMGISHTVRDRFEAQLHHRFGDLRTMFRTADAVANIRTAGLIVHDADDLEVPCTEGVVLAKRWTEGAATLEITSGLGHRRLLRDDAVLQRVADFVGGPAPAI